MNLKQVDIVPSTEFAEGYVAGFFDGEGSVGLYLERNRPTPRISLTNYDWHVKNYVSALLLPILGIDALPPKYAQIRISSWEGVGNFVKNSKNYV